MSPISNSEQFKYIGINSQTGMVVLSDNNNKQIECIIDEPIQIGVLKTIKLPTKISGDITFYRVVSGNFETNDMFTNLVNTKELVLANGDYYVDKILGEVTVKSVKNGTIGAIYKYSKDSDINILKNEVNDLVKTFTYLDAGTADERVSKIEYSSLSTGLYASETFNYLGSAGMYRVSSIIISNSGD